MTSAELSRMIANLIKQGTVAETNPAAGRVRVQLGELVTDWLPYFVPAAGGVSVHRPPSSGENCIVLSPSGEPANGLVLCGLASTQHPQPAQSADTTVMRCPDGAVFEYNHASGSLKISGIQTAEIQAAASLKIDCPQSTITGKLTVQGLLTYQAGMAGSNSAGGAAATITGNITHTEGSLSSNGITLHSHTHSGVQLGGGNTGAPQ